MFTREQADEYLDLVEGASAADYDVDALKACVTAGALAQDEFAMMAAAHTKAVEEAGKSASKADKPKSAWLPFTDLALPQEVQALVLANTAAQAAAKATREKMEAAIAAGITVPAGKVLVFSYQYGPALAILDDDGKRRRARKTSKPKIALGDIGKAS